MCEGRRGRRGREEGEERETGHVCAGTVVTIGHRGRSLGVGRGGLTPRRGQSSRDAREHRETSMELKDSGWNRDLLSPVP